MSRDEYGHYVNEQGVEIRVSTDKNGKDHIDIYGSCPAEDEEHVSIHIDYDSKTGKGQIVDTTNGEKEVKDTLCFITTACMRHMRENFDNNCEELTLMRYLRDNYVSQEDIDHYYEVAPIIVEILDDMEDNNKIYNYIYENVIKVCVDAVKNKNFDFAYSKYKNCVTVLEEEYTKPILKQRLNNALKLKLTNN